MSSVMIKTNGREYDGFTNVDISRSLDAAVSDMSLTVAAWSATKFPPGSTVEIFVEKKKVLTGYFSRFKGSQGSRKTSTTLIFRSKTCDLVDSDAEPTTFVNRTPQEIANALAAPHGVTVKALTDFTRIPKVRVQPGEKIFATIERALRSQYGLITDDADGNLVLTQVTSDMDDGSKRRLVVGGNVLNIDYDFDWDQRFKTIKMFGQGAGEGNVDVRQVAVANDENAERNRLLILVGGAQQPGVNAKNRVEWERNQRIGKAIQIEVEAQGWLDPTGEPWMPNIMCSLTAPMVGWTNIPFLLVSTRFRLNNSGQSVTQLSLRPWKAYAPPSESKMSLRAQRFRTPFLTPRQMEWMKRPRIPYRDDLKGVPPPSWLTDKQSSDLDFKALPKGWRAPNK